MNDDPSVAWLSACVSAVVIGAALKWGMLPSRAGGFIHRKKDPWTYWSTIGALGAILLACVVVAISPSVGAVQASARPPGGGHPARRAVETP